MDYSITITGQMSAVPQPAPNAVAPPPASAVPAPAPSKETPGWAKVLLCFGLIAISAVVIGRTFVEVRKASRYELQNHSVNWTMPSGAHLREPSGALRYDADEKKLVHRGSIDANEQLRLRDLLEADQPASSAATASPAASKSAKAHKSAASGKGAAATKAQSATASAETSAQGQELTASQWSAIQRSYHQALYALADADADTRVEQLMLLIYLGALGGTLGALLRTFVDFVGNASYKDALDLERWWPLYVTRPVVGAILGFLLVVLFKAQLITHPDGPTGSDTFWWLGVAAIGGFSTIDVTNRLRVAAKALFGDSDKGKA